MEFVDLFLSQFGQTSWLEFVAVFFGLASVWYSKQENVLVYPTGIINVLIYVWIAFQYKIYADSAINAYYFFMSIYGWYYWTSSKGESQQVPISASNRLEIIISLMIVFGAFLIIRFGLSFTDSDIPNLDAISTAIPIAAMWLMARKKVEHWIFWIITDVIAVPLYFYKGLPMTGLQYFIWTIIAVLGWRSWRIKLKRIQEEA